MRNSKKLLSLFLAVVMLLSVFTVMASAAYTVGDEVDGGVNYKYTVEKVDTIPANKSTGSEEYSADNLYAVSVWVQSDTGIAYLTMPVHFNKEHFAPVVLAAEGATFPLGVGFNQDEYYASMEGDGALYTYALGDYMNNTSMYKSTGATVTNKALAQCIGLGNSNAGLIVTAEFISADHTNYAKWSANLPSGTGIVYANLDVWTISKNAYFNTISGIEVDTGWNKMFTFYFETLPGVTDADVIGDEFGIYTSDAFGVDAFCDSNAGYYSSSAVKTTPALNVVSNAVVEAAAEPTIVNPLKGQIRFDKKDGAYAGTFDVRALATITEKDFNATFTDAATAEDMIEEIGFVFAAGSNVGTPDMAGVKALVENGTALSGYEKKTVDYISTGATNVAAGNYVFSCIVTDVPDADKADSLVAVGYIKWTDAEGTHYNYYPAAQEISFNALYTAHYNSAFPQA